MDEVELVQ